MNTNSKFAARFVIYLSFALMGGIVFAHNGEHHAHSEKHGESHTPTDMENLKTINEDYLKQVKTIFQKSCFDCHSSQTTYPWYSKIPGVKNLIQNDIQEARTHLDMSQDFPFSGHGTPTTDLEAIRDQINKGEMPPSRYRFMHSASKLTKADEDAVLKWIETSLSKLSRGK